MLQAWAYYHCILPPITVDREGEITCSHLLKQIVAEIKIGNRSPDSQVSTLSQHHTENSLLDRKKKTCFFNMDNRVFVIKKGMNGKQ